MSRAAVKKTAARGRAPKVPDRTLARIERGERVLVRRGKKAVAAVVSLEDLKALEELEDRLDAEALQQALAEPGRMPYEEFRKKLGL